MSWSTDGDPPGTWRCLWTAADSCGPNSPNRQDASDPTYYHVGVFSYDEADLTASPTEPWAQSVDLEGTPRLPGTCWMTSMSYLDPRSTHVLVPEMIVHTIGDRLGLGHCEEHTNCIMTARLTGTYFDWSNEAWMWQPFLRDHVKNHRKAAQKHVGAWPK